MKSKTQIQKKSDKEIFTRQEFDEPRNFTQLLDACKILVASKILPKEIDTPEKAAVVILTGRELGLRMMASTRQVYVVNGKPALSSQMMLSLAYGTKELEDIEINERGTGESAECTVTVKRKGKKPYVYTFSVTMAKKLGKYANEWLKQPENMCKQRAIAGNLRVTFPDAILGMYTPEEVQSIEPTEVVKPTEMPKEKKQKLEIENQESDALANEKQIAYLRKMAFAAGIESDGDYLDFLETNGVKNADKITVSQFGSILKKLGAKIDEAARKKSN